MTAAKADSTIWSGRFEGKETDILALEDQIATATIDGIRKRVLSEKWVPAHSRDLSSGLPSSARTDIIGIV
jgi:hypothetical protein